MNKNKRNFVEPYHYNYPCLEQPETRVIIKSFSTGYVINTYSLERRIIPCNTQSVLQVYIF